MTGKEIAIIGAGISGLLACKSAIQKGFSPVIFEARNCIGGVWSNNIIETTKLQTPKNYYQFSDFVWPAAAAERQQMMIGITTFPITNKLWSTFTLMLLTSTFSPESSSILRLSPLITALQINLVTIVIWKCVLRNSGVVPVRLSILMGNGMSLCRMMI